MRALGKKRIPVPLPSPWFWAIAVLFVLVGLIGQAMVVLFVSFFLMTAGDSFRRKMVKLAGPTFSKKKITIQMLDEITGQIHHYLMIQVFTSVLVGVATWLSMWWIGLERTPDTAPAVAVFEQWRRQLYQAVIMHGDHGNPAAHLF